MRVERKTNTIEGLQFAEVDFDALIAGGEPCIVKGALAGCPLVTAGRASDRAAMSHLSAFANERPVLIYTAGAEAKTRFFYNPQMDGLNFTTEYMPLAEFFETLNNEKLEGTGAAFYVGSAELDNHFPGLVANDGLAPSGQLFTEHPPRVGIWLGNRTTAATHFDVSNNIAACMVGRRRFTLFPPDQVENLYPGPLEPTPGGQVVSMVDLNAPDFKQFPNAEKALQQAQVADLEAGDVLVYPAMWWHQVEALADFNVLINYWWNPVSPFMDDPMNTLLHALLSLRDRPASEKSAWRSLFDYYVFGDSNRAREHLPEYIQGPLAPMTDITARRLRAKLLKKLNR
ncbi:cupin-like domain-containing protein [Exilibacterium tricleocarpae]|uniref:Cupin-like domain-containing protein n=1 Tax=Exilibacterium tricleocarpae TaxID=2591008 RepID=A0A545TLR0_9GAMM|nr:cupin-like domain-containing protein [Exilibacterium tricleocarpae]TQV78177.1 cupin-like domain-containing protein [Exilibacterium tricleocarpae]